MPAGRMDQRITLQRFVETSDGGGGVTKAAADFPVNPNVWAHVKARSGRESLTDGRMNATFVVVFEIYNRDDINDLSQIVWQGTPYNIRGILTEGGRALRVKIEAERGVVP